ncbi:MAG TPA: thioredoxin domain-containing protein [Phototrophicaceae bacterium]|nr:thioredoxin domain-containing protein [Phototrophicaceae bacterium]
MMSESPQDDSVAEPMPSIEAPVELASIETPISAPISSTDSISHRVMASGSLPTETLTPTINVNQLTMNYIVVALVFLGVGILIGRLIFGGSGALNPDDLRAMINEAVAQSGGLTDQTSTAKLIDDDPAFGPETAPITIVEFSDFNCAFCTKFATETLPRLRETYGDDVRYVYRDMPIIGGNISVGTAIAAECANDQGKFWDYHNLLFSNSQARSQEAYVNFASELGLDANTFTTCLSDKSKSDEVMLDMLDGQGLDIRGTPAFYVNGRFISGAQPFEVFQTVINSELDKAGIQPPA